MADSAHDVVVFGHLPDGRPVHAVTLARDGLRVEILTLGATVRDLLVDCGGQWRSIVLGLATLDDYVRHSQHFGCVAGRCANRIRDGRFVLDGVSHQLTRNAGAHHLHGGQGGYGTRLWTLSDHGSEHVTLTLTDPPGTEGYPGRVETTCRYGLGPGRVLAIELTAKTDAPTLVNLATHTYFDIDRGPDVLSHSLQVVADRFTPVDRDGIPTGEILPVEGTPLDFRTPRAIDDGPPSGHRPIDHNFVLAGTPRAAPQMAARLTGPRSGLTVEVWTTEPGLQVYDGLHLHRLAVPVADGRRLGAHAGLCLEPQRFPDAIHHSGFASAVLRPGDIYKQQTEYRVFCP